MQPSPVTADVLVERYGLGRAEGPMRHVERHWAGHVSELETAAGRVVFTRLHDYVKPADIEVEAGLVERAAAAGIRAPAPIRTTAGDVVASVDGLNWRAHEWLRLGPAPTKPPSPPIAAAAGRVLATLHGLALPPVAPVVRWLTSRRPEQAWHAIAERARRDEAEWAEDLAAAVPAFLALHAVHDERDPNERAILSHAWPAPDAVRVAEDDEAVIVGWEHACAIPADWEVGAALRAWSEGGEYGAGAAAAQALLDAYRERIGGPERVELRMFSSIVTAWLNWTATRAQIALTCDDAEQRDEASRHLRGLLEDPLTIDKLEHLVAVLR